LTTAKLAKQRCKHFWLGLGKNTVQPKLWVEPQPTTSHRKGEKKETKKESQAQRQQKAKRL
jgi:hypothetical protein